MPTITAEVDVDLDDFDTEELVRELKSRNREVDTAGQTSLIETSWDPIEGKSFDQLLDAVYEARVLSKDERTLELIDRLIYSASGRIV
ncbi:hypothetical protein [Chromohalobacter canadensis]|uniref:hypothetical protein n=1 Tax=Chromohalobacter canadensis TaxID=141389 RepID=UPI002410297F|nr:hypothetical protein [Chromohalobacter canadensis]